MEQLQIRAEQFRKQGRLQEDDLEQIIKEMKQKGRSRKVKEGRGKPHQMMNTRESWRQ
jgi:hypothetical protein